MFGPLLGWYIIYTFLGALAQRNFAPCKIQFTSGSCILLYWQHYCTALQQRASAKLSSIIQGMEFSHILVAHASKILLKILAHRLESKAELFLCFRKGCGTIDATAVMQVLCERSMEYNMFVFVLLIANRHSTREIG